MVNRKLLIYLLAGLLACTSLAETEKDEAPVKLLSDEVRVKRSSEGDVLSKDELRPRKQKKAVALDNEDSLEESPVRKANERQHGSGNHTKKFRAKDPDDSAEVKETKSSNAKAVEISPNSEKVENFEKAEKTKEKESDSGKSARGGAAKEELSVKEKAVRNPDLPAAPVAPATPPVLQSPTADTISQTYSQSSSQPPSDDSGSFAIFYYFSGVLFVVLAILAGFLYNALFKPPTPQQQSARAAAAPHSYAKVPQSDVEMSLSATRAATAKEESDWEEWDGEEKTTSAPPPLPMTQPSISSPTSNNSSDDSEDPAAVLQLGSRASPSTSRTRGSPPLQSATTTAAAPKARESRRSFPNEAGNSDLFASIGISAAPKFQPPIAKPTVSSRGRFAPASPEPVSKVSLKDQVDAGRWGDDDGLDGLIDSD